STLSASGASASTSRICTPRLSVCEGGLPGTAGAVMSPLRCTAVRDPGPLGTSAGAAAAVLVGEVHRGSQCYWRTPSMDRPRTSGALRRVHGTDRRRLHGTCAPY